jgi:uncharacterized protein YukE
MSFEGMDVDQLQGLAKQIDSDAQALYNLVTSLTGVVDTLTLLWNGPMAATFEQDWQSKNRPTLLAAHNTLRDLHTYLVSNISQQTSASAAEGGWTAGRAAGDLEDGIKAIGVLGIPVTLISELGKAPDSLDGAGPLTKAWSYATDDHLFSLSPDGAGWVKTTAEFVAGHPLLDDGLKTVGLAGSAVGVVHVVEDSYRASEDLDDGNYAGAANEFAEGVADGLQAYPSPVTYLAGVDIKLLDQVANLDWKDTPNPFSGTNFEQYYLPEFESMKTGAYWEQAGKTLWGDM